MNPYQVPSQGEWDLEHQAPVWNIDQPQAQNTWDGAQPQPQAPQQPVQEVDVIRELVNAISLLGRDSEESRSVLIQQSGMLSQLQSQFQQSTHDSAELTRRVADHAAKAFQTLASNSGGGSSAAGTSRPVSIKVREPRMFSGKADDVEPFIREVKTYIQLQRGAFVTDNDKTLFFSLYLKSGVAESWYNAVCINEKALLQDFDAFIRAFIARFQSTDLASKYLDKIEALEQTSSASTYANQFFEYLAYLDWTEETKLTQFNRGLKPELRRALAITKRETTLEKWAQVVVEADKNLYQVDREIRRRGGNKSSTNNKSSGNQSSNTTGKGRDQRDSRSTTSQPSSSTTNPAPSSSTSGVVPMDVDAMRQSRPRGPLTDAEKEHRRKNNLCFYCGEGNHSFKNCPKKNPAAPASRSAGKA